MKKFKRIVLVISLNAILLFSAFYCINNLFLAITEKKIEVCPRSANHSCYYATYHDQFATFISTFIIYGIGAVGVIGLYYWYFFKYKVHLRNARSHKNK